MKRYSDYDRFARIYSRHWGGFSRRVLPVLEDLMLNDLPAGARVLDVCCGAGHLAALLTERGYAVTGIDGSKEMIRRARRNAPAAEFLVADARAFEVSPGSFDAALSLYDSLNHVTEPQDLAAVFRNVRAALRPGGRFVFDLNMEEGYGARWEGSISIVEDDCVCVVRARYDADRRTGCTDVTFFERLGTWRRTDLTLTQRCHAESDVRAALEAAGFGGVRACDAERDLRMDGAIGRAFFACVAAGP
jgi:SAM-dependent methyltransferase